MTVELRDVETEDHVVLVWTSDRRGDVLPNPRGVEVEHLTRVIAGSVDIKIRGGGKTIRLSAGQEIRLPVGTPYAFRTLSAETEVRCFYPKRNAKALADIGHLRSVDGVKRPVSEGRGSLDVVERLHAGTVKRTR